MKRTLLLLTLVTSLSAPLAAQQAGAPLLESEFESNETIPGQYLTLRLTILVPTWLPKPVVFPSMELPDLRVRLPEGSTTPMSRTIDGETWSGVSRRYLLSPMRPGSFTIAPQDVVVTYADPGNPDPEIATLQTDPITLTGLIPEGAEGLDPFIAAEALTLTQEVSTPTTGLKPGAGVTRTLTASLTGASPIVLPTLLPDTVVPGMQTYADPPRITEMDDRGALSGTRVESETLMAVSGGSGEAPPVTLDWFNLKTAEVETASVEGVPLSVDAPVATPPRKAPDWRIAAALLVCLAALALLRRRLWPHFAARLRRRRAAHIASKSWARQQLLHAIGQRDLAATRRWLTIWNDRPPAPTAKATAEISVPLTRIGAALYGSSPTLPDQADWRALEAAVRKARPERAHRAASLPPLNPAGH